MTVFFKALCSYSSGDQGPCRAEAEYRASVGCVHEHVRDVRVCEVHLVKVDNGVANCRECDQSNDPHFCKLTLLGCDEIRWREIGTVVS